MSPQFTPEAESFYAVKNFDLLGQNITIPGLSPKFPQAHCTYNGEICQVTTGEGGTLHDFQLLDGCGNELEI